jgi:hypothetical protein
MSDTWKFWRWPAAIRLAWQAMVGSRRPAPPPAGERGDVQRVGGARI